MGAVAAAAVAIGSAIATATAAVVSVVSAVVAAIGTAVAAVASAISMAIGSVIATVTSSIGAIAGSIGAAVSSAVSTVSATLVSWTGTAWEFANVVFTSIKAFTAAIHLKTIMMVHEIAYILSSDYRKLILKIEGAIVDLGESIGASRDGIILAFKNAETLVEDVSGVLGRSYDLSNVTWLKTLSGYLRGAKSRIKDMENGLQDILPDIEENVIKPALDGLSEAQRGWFTLIKGLGDSLETATSSIDNLFKSVDDVRVDLNNLNDSLPDTISDQIDPLIDNINEGFESFRRDIYQPFKTEVGDLINTLRGSMDRQRQDIDRVVDRILKPGDYLKEIDEFTKDTRIEQEDKISELSSRTRKRETDEMSGQTQMSFDKLEAIKDILEQEFPPAKWKIAEIEKLMGPIGGESRAADTWYVGDF